MYVNILMERMDGAGPEVKVFLMRYLLRYAGQREVPVTVKGLVKELGVNDRGVSKSLKYLTEGGYLINESANSGGRGRPKQRLSPGHELQQLEQKWSGYEQKFHHFRTIERLLEVNNLSINSRIGETTDPKNCERSDGTAFRGGMRLSNLRRLLICTLLVHADQAGVVRHLSLRDLASLVGVSVEQVRWNIKILKKGGQILYYFPAMVMRGGKGRSKSIFGMPVERLEIAQKQILITVASDALTLFSHAVLLAYKLRQRDELDFQLLLVPEIFNNTYESWNVSSYMSEKDFEVVIKYIDLFLHIGQAGGIYRAQSVFCEFTMRLLEELGADVPFEKEAKDKVINKISSLKEELYVLWPEEKLNEERALAWVYDLIYILYFEACRVLKMHSEARSQRIISRSLTPFGYKELYIFCLVEDCSASKNVDSFV